MIRNNKNPRVAIVSLTSCEGCQFAILDLAKDFLDISKKIDIVNFRLIDEEKHSGNYDVAFVEGNPITKENIKTLQRIRMESKVLICLGNCADMGGIPEIKNHNLGQRTINYVYKKPKGIDNPSVLEISRYVKLDYVIRGCPINGLDFFRIIYSLLAKQEPRDYKWPVCYECQHHGYECLLQKHLPCLGPITQGGCQAVCCASKQECQGCRGILPDSDVKKFVDFLYKNYRKDLVEANLTMFGLKSYVNN